ncbi:Spermidine/putrescine-binding periplasmic protein-like protein [Psychromonas ingrahamii 37]|uniref:Spermidine/putrescine-binding periplasmic protein-like protein n=1 Tax=Psychromonas ingrahamii (strain DSM 17664 / CCUG 51855 / 37) TaxID=357804 RepID=A1SUA3_PSYIN|nr:spermidine/putrescine ABC transporter substrate-binding protein [Psychromonas ingrahamii]ABM03068.1 Spermidine/putrescine-binding periplasmic protein-like protein [Psychromonas ingrahamii 37]
MIKKLIERSYLKQPVFNSLLSVKNRLVVLCLCFFVVPLYGQEIKILTWGDYLSESVVKTFTKKTGHTVKLYYYDSGPELSAMLTNGQGSQFDLVLADNEVTGHYGKEGLFQSLTSISIDNVQYNNLQSQQACSQYGIPYAQGTMGIIYRSSISKTVIDSWQNLLSPPKEHVGTTMMFKDDIDTIAIALLAQGLDPFSVDEDELKSAYLLLSAQTKDLLRYGYSVSYVLRQGKSSQLTLAPSYSDDLKTIKRASSQNDWKYVVPKEGTLFFVDCFTAPSDAVVKEGTKAFLAFINDPVMASKNAQDIGFYTTNEAALLISSDEYKNDREISPSAEILKRSYKYKRLPESDVIIRNKMVTLLQTQE